MTLLNEVAETLKKDERLVADGKLLKNKIMELSLKLDSELLKRLLSNKTLKEAFFINVSGMVVFDRDKFIKFVDNKQFLPDSYTVFKNKIGLSSKGREISNIDEVVLVWPHKDCVLEGGMEKEGDTRSEKFYNEVLAPDEIDCLTDRKVFTNFKIIDAKGEHRITELDITKENLIIKGNNLLALHSLKKKFAGAVKLIYIDPPYNRDADSFYNDTFKRSTWLTFMKNRLEVAKELLRPDGAIFIQIDDTHHPYLKVLCDEIFREENNPVTIYVQVRYGQKTLSEKNDFQKLIEQILVYQRPLFKPIKEKEEYTLEKFVWEIVERTKGHRLTIGNRSVVLFKENEYEIVEKKPSVTLLKETWASGTVLKNNASGKFFNDHLASRIKTDGLGCLYKVSDIGEDGLGYRYFTGPKREGATKGKFYSGVPLDRVEELKKGTAEKELVIPNYYDFAADFGNCRGEGAVELRSGKKPEVLIKKIIEMVSANKGDIILDFFLGTGTTAAVAHKMGFRYIGVEQLDYAENDAVVRLKNVIGREVSQGKLEASIEKFDKTGVSEDVGWNGGGSFVYCELMKQNEKFIDAIITAKTTDDLSKIWEKVKTTAFLSYRIRPEEFEKNKSEFSELSIENQKKFLLECLEKNHLYVNFSEIDDNDNKVSEIDKKLNRQFYGETV